MNSIEDMLMETSSTNEELIAAMRLTRDLKKSAGLLSLDQARYLVDLYYSLQKLRIGAAAQVRSAGDEPNMLIKWTEDMYEKLENDVKSALLVFAQSQIPGRWAMSIKGIGPVISAGLLAHIDIEKTPTAGALWRFAGYDPTVKWERKTKRPWNARLKVLGWKAGQSFVKSSGREGSHYGPLYRERKRYEIEKNERKEYAEQARAILASKNIGADTEARKWYEMGMLPPAHIQARAERYAVKIFLSHYHAVAYENHYGKKAPTPYAIAFLEHTHEIAIPNWPLKEA